MFTASTLIMVTIVAAPSAFAIEGVVDGGGTVTEETVYEFGEAGPFAYAFDPVTGSLRIDLFAETTSEADLETPQECLPPEDSIDETAIETATTQPDGETELPEGCLVVDASGPNGQINHGTVVSSVVHALKEIRDQLDGPFGQYVREFARSDLGRSADGPSVEADPPAGADDKPKGRPDGRGNSEVGGPPEHSNAGGNGRGRNG